MHDFIGNKNDILQWTRSFFSLPSKEHAHGCNGLYNAYTVKLGKGATIIQLCFIFLFVNFNGQNIKMYQSTL